MRLLAFACFALVAAGCRHAVPPGGFGVDLTIDGTKLTRRASVASVTITASGAESYFSGAIPAASQIEKSGVLRVRYVPGVDSGSLAFVVDALDATGNVLGEAQSAAVTLKPGRAVDVDLALADFVVTPPDMALADLAPSTCSNGVLDPGEVDVDCGGPCALCEPGKLCNVDTDCSTHTCLVTGAGDMAVHRCELASSPPFWTPLTSLPVARSGAAAVGTSDGGLYVVGGVTSTIEASTLSFSFATNDWTATGSMAKSRAFMPVAYAGGKLFAIGGENITGTTVSYLTSIESFDPSTQVWSPVMHFLNVDRAEHSAAVGADHLVYVYGGIDFEDMLPQALLESFDPTMDANAAITNTMQSLPVARYSMAGTADSLGRVLAIGGLTTSGTTVKAYDEVDVYDTTKVAWAAGPVLEIARGGAGAALGGDGRVYVAGGQSSLGSPLATVEAISATSDHWTTVAPLGTARSQLAVTSGADGRIYAIGGSVTSTAVANVEAYGPHVAPGPATGPANTAVAIAGTNFAASSTVTINVSDGTTTMLAATGTTDVSGTLSPSPVWKVPSTLAAGTYTLSATDDRSRYTVQASFVVQ